jgi:S1-C subfamily serine protease
MRLTNGFAKITTRYDSEGNQTAPSYFDESGKPLATEVYIVEVLSEGQAQQVGLRQNDVILSYDGKAVPTVGEFIRLTLAPGGSLREMRVWRNGRVETSQLKPGRVGISIEIRAAQLSSDRTESPNQ